MGIEGLKELARNIRIDIVEMTGFGEHTGHIGGACSSADIIAALYGSVMKYDPKNPDYTQRDRFILSKGHAAIVQYAAMAEVGFFDKALLNSFKKLGSPLQGHPDRLKLPGIEVGTGSLGQGLSISVGMALALKLNRIDSNVYCLMGDGEIAEGQIWEAAMAAKNYHLNNLIGIVDKNNLQATGTIEERFNTNPLPDKWISFGWKVVEINGHDFNEILEAFEEAKENTLSPTLIIADTIKGKGISFAENSPGYHNIQFTKEQYEKALKELKGEAI